MNFKVFNKEYRLDTNFFEAAFTFCCMVAGGVIGFLYMPNNVPLSMFNYIAIATMLGFVFGFGTSSGIVIVYKKIQKSLEKK